MQRSLHIILVTGLTARTEGVDLVNFAQLSQHSAIMMVSMKDSGIETLNDFDGKRIGIWMSGFEEVPKALINEYGLEVEWIPILSSVNLFLAGGLDMYDLGDKPVKQTQLWEDDFNRHDCCIHGLSYPETPY